MGESFSRFLHAGKKTGAVGRRRKKRKGREVAALLPSPPPPLSHAPFQPLPQRFTDPALALSRSYLTELLLSKGYEVHG